jgi:PTH1 family peptidyl-tRNA hydrolase
MAKLIVGLGNPGDKYERTRHNAGFRAVRAFHTLHALDLGNWSSKFGGLVSEGRVGGDKIILLLPQTFMNESGRAVREAVDFWRLKTEDLIIVYDDLDLPIGTLRLREEGSAGGHKGVASIIEHLKDPRIARVRIGIGTDRAKTVPAADYVLERFSGDEEPAVAQVISRAAAALDRIIERGIVPAMNEFNG